LLDDVAAGRVSAKMFVFLTAWCLSPQERRNLLKATTGALKVWCYAPGYQEPDSISLRAMRELTGFTLKQVALPNAWAKPTAAGRRLGLTKRFGPDRPIHPLFAAVDVKPDEVLAVYSDGSAAVALRQAKGGPSLFVGPPGLTSELLRLAARKAGVHLFVNGDCNVYANGPYLVLHAARDGAVKIDTGWSGPIRDLISGQSIGTGPRFQLELKLGQTRVLAGQTHDHL